MNNPNYQYAMPYPNQNYQPNQVEPQMYPNQNLKPGQISDFQAAGKDHIVISDTRDGKRYILLLVYLDYVEFDEPINYEYPIN